MDRLRPAEVEALPDAPPPAGDNRMIRPSAGAGLPYRRRPSRSRPRRKVFRSAARLPGAAGPPRPIEDRQGLLRPDRLEDPLQVSRHGESRPAGNRRPASRSAAGPLREDEIRTTPDRRRRPRSSGRFFPAPLRQNDVIPSMIPMLSCCNPGRRQRPPKTGGGAAKDTMRPPGAVGVSRGLGGEGHAGVGADVGVGVHVQDVKNAVPETQIDAGVIPDPVAR